jgi:RNA polymerase sigma factor (sigma-70 family)
MEAELLKFEAAEEEAMTISPELIAAIRETIKQLPDKTRQVIVSILIQGKKYKETAEELNVSVNTVKTLLNYGVKQLRKQFPDTLLLIFYCIENDSLTL